MHLAEALDSERLFRVLPCPEVATVASAAKQSGPVSLRRPKTPVEAAQDAGSFPALEVSPNRRFDYGITDVGAPTCRITIQRN